jgi:hypothetical protein
MWHGLSRHAMVQISVPDILKQAVRPLMPNAQVLKPDRWGIMIADIFFGLHLSKELFFINLNRLARS